MGPVGLPSHGTRALAGLALGLSGVGSSVLPRDGTSLAVAANETAHRLSFNATAAQTQAALVSLSSIGGVGGSVSVTQVGGVSTVTFGGSLAGTNVAQVTGAAGGGASVAVATVSGPSSEVQQVTVVGGSGTFSLLAVE